MNGRKLIKGKAAIGQSRYMSGKKRTYYLEAISACLNPTGRTDPATLTLSNREDGPPLHCIYFDQVQRLSTVQATRTILLELTGGGNVEIVTDEEAEWRRWAKHIGLLLTLPRYLIPEEPNDIAMPKGLSANIDPKIYHSGGVMAWGMCVLEDGIGAAAGMRDAFCVAIITDTDKLLVFPWNVTAPLIIWEREHIRRSGSIGNLVFLEAGRRCRFGPGLLWMYSITSVVLSLRDGLHTFLFKGNEEFKQKVIETGARRPSTSSERGCSIGSDSAILESGSGSRRHATLPSFPSTSGTNRDSGISSSHEYKEPRSLNSSSSYKGEYVNVLPVEASKRRMSNETASPRYNDSQMHLEPVHDRSYSPEDLPFAFEPASLLDEGMSPRQSKESGQYIKMNRVGLPPLAVEEDTVGYVSVGPAAFSSQPTTTLHQQMASQRFSGPYCPQTQEQLLKERQQPEPYDDCMLKSCPANRPSYENVIRHF